MRPHTPKRLPAFPDVPTMKELGYPDLISYSWFGISVPAKTPQPIVDKLSKTIAEAAKAGDVGQHVFHRHHDFVHHDAAGHRGAQAELAFEPGHRTRIDEHMHAAGRHAANHFVDGVGVEAQPLA